jgi:hypothetical protein
MKSKYLETQLNAYIKDKHTQEECTGFIDGYKSAKEHYSDIIVLAACLGAAFGSVVGALAEYFN